MWANFAKFIWNHFWKMLSAGFTLFIIWFVDSIQQPEKVQATMMEYGRDIAYLKDESLQFKISLGTNTELYRKIDNKMDKLTDAVIGLSHDIKALDKQR